MANRPAKLSSVGRTFYEAFRAIHGWVVSGLALILAIVIPIFLPETTIPVRYLWLPLALFVLIILTLVEAFVETRAALRNAAALPADFSFEVLRTRRPDNNPEHGVLLLLRCGGALGFDSYVSVYSIADDDFEILLGLGVVRNIQESGLVQVEVEAWLANKRDELDKILTNDPKHLSALRVKPSGSRDFLTLSYPKGFDPVIPIIEEGG